MRFGDAISYDSKEYIYFANTDLVFHLGIVADEIKSRNAIKFRDGAFTMGNKNMQKRQESIVICFIELTTEELKNRAAYYIRTTDHNFKPEDSFDQICTLNMKDQIALKQEIMKDGHVTKELKELVKDLELEKI